MYVYVKFEDKVGSKSMDSSDAICYWWDEFNGSGYYEGEYYESYVLQ